MNTSVLRNFRLHVVLLVTALVALSLLLIPSPALGVTVLVDIPGGSGPYPVGATVPAYLEVAISGQEFLPENAEISLMIAPESGGQFAEFTNLPIVLGSFSRTIRSCEHCPGTSIDKMATLSGTVTHQNLTTVPGGGYGYPGGYGYVGGTNAKIIYTLEFTHQILLDPEPTSFPIIPANAALFNIDVGGAVGGYQDTGETFNVAQFPDFDGLGEAFGNNIPFEGEARALDARIVNNEIKLGIITDGFTTNNVYAQLVKGDGFYVFVESDFPLPDVTDANCPTAGCNMGDLHALTFTGDSSFVVAGGSASDGSDAFAALLNLTPDASYPTGATLVSGKVIDLSTYFGNRPGGAAYDSDSGLVHISAYQSSPSASVTIAVLDFSAGSIYQSAYTTPLGFASLPGFNGLGYNDETDTFFGAVSPGGGADLANDDIVDATYVSNTPFSDSGATNGASDENGELQPCAGISNTVWYQFSPGSSGDFSVSTQGSNYDTVISVYTSNANTPTDIATANLSELECNDDFWGMDESNNPINYGVQSRVDFSAVVDEVIYIQVGGFYGQTGNLNFTLIAEGEIAATGGGEGAIIEFDSSGNPVATHFIGEFPAPGQAISGIGIETPPGGDTTVIFGITENTRDVVFAELGEAAAVAGDDEYTNEPVFVNRNLDSNEILVGVMGDPNRLLKFHDNSPHPHEIFGLPSGNVDAGTWVPGTNGPGRLWVVDMDGSTSGALIPIDTNTGAADDNASIDLPAFVGEIGGLAHYMDNNNTPQAQDDVLKFVLYERYNDTYYIIDSVTHVVQVKAVFDSNQSDAFYPPYGAEAAEIVKLGGIDTLLVGKFNQILKINLEAGALEGGFNTSLFDIKGLGSGGSILIADFAYPYSRIVGSRLPGEPEPEITTAGDYSLHARTVINGVETWNNSFEQLSFEKLDEVTLTITEPVDGSAVVGTPVTFKVEVDDPTVTQVQLNQGVEESTLVGATNGDGPSTFDTTADKAQYTTSGLFHFTDVFDGPDDLGDVAYYGQDNTFNYETAGVNSGFLETPQFTVGSGTTISFGTYGQTEGGFDFDKMQGMFCQNGTCSVIFQIVDIPEALFGFGPGGGGGGPGGPMGPMQMVGDFFGTPGEIFDGPQFLGYKFIFVPSDRRESGKRVLTDISFPLAELVPSLMGLTGTLRFNFDTDDAAMNEFTGWVLDDVEVIGPDTSGLAFNVVDGVAEFGLALEDGENTVDLVASSRVPGTDNGTASVTVIYDTAAPIISMDAVTTPTQLLTQTVSGSYVESSPDVLTIHINGVLKKSVKSFTADNTFSELITLSSGSNLVEVQLTDSSGRLSDSDANTSGDQPASNTIVVDLAVPIISASIVPILSDTALRAGDPFFIVANATDDTSNGAVDTDITSASYTDSAGNTLGTLAAVGDVAQVIIKKHGLGQFTTTGVITTTHVLMATVPDGASAGEFTVNLKATDGAGNVGVATATGSVVASLSDRTAFLGAGFNYVGFPLIAEVADLETLLNQSIDNASAALVTALGRDPTLLDVVETIQSWSGGPSATGQFLTFTPGASNGLEDLEPFIGLIVKVKSEVSVNGTAHSVFDTEANPTGQGVVDVPIAWNVDGPFIVLGGLPPSKELIPGFNHWTPHAQDSILFVNALRGALIGGSELAVSAITAVNRIDATIDPSQAGGFTVEVEQGFLSAFPGDALEILRSYFTFLVGNSNATIS